MKLYKNNIFKFSFESTGYTNLFEEVYDYAKLEQENADIAIGNIMRQLLEAFGTFQYKVSMEQLTTEDEVLSLLSIEYRRYFEHLMYRVVLNCESHSRYQVEANPGILFQNLYSFKEKQRIAKDVLCLIYLLNREHVLAHMRKKGNEAFNRQIEVDLNAWCEEIKNKKL